MTLVRLGELTWPRAGELDGAVGLVPLGAVEQHGPHLPLATDTLIAQALGEAVADVLPGPVVVAPVIVGGLSTHHLGFAGTVTLPPAVLEGSIDALVEAFGRFGLDRVGVFSAHGGNFAFLGEYGAARDGVAAYSDLNGFLVEMFAAARSLGVEPPETDVHAGALETSIALHLFPQLVGDYRSATGLMEASPGWLARLLEEGVRPMSETGVLGDPSLATAELGAALFARLRDHLAGWLAAELPPRAHLTQFCDDSVAVPGTVTRPPSAKAGARRRALSQA